RRARAPACNLRARDCRRGLFFRTSDRETPHMHGSVNEMQGLLAAPMAALDDEEGARIPPDLPEVIDAHVHLFSDGVARAIQEWFDRHAWPIRYRQPAAALTDFLHDRGISRVIALHYSHKPDMARALNRFMAEMCKRHPMIRGVATVLPGEPEATQILEEAAQL